MAAQNRPAAGQRTAARGLEAAARRAPGRARRSRRRRADMARSLWTGSLSFGLVNVPVTLVTAVRDLDLHFRQLHKKDAAPIEVQRWCSEEDVEIPFDEITHSYELDDGQEVVVTDEELESVEPRKTRTIDIEQFVD